MTLILTALKPASLKLAASQAAALTLSEISLQRVNNEDFFDHLWQWAINQAPSLTSLAFLALQQIILRWSCTYGLGILWVMSVVAAGRIDFNPRPKTN